MQSVCFKYAGRFAAPATLWVLLLTAVTAYADNSKISPDLLPLLGNSGSVNVVVQYNTAPQTCATGLLGGLVCTVTTIVGGVVNQVFGLINAVSATVQLAEVVNLSNQSNVTYISLDRQVSATLDYSTAAVNAPAAWNAGWDGTGVGIAIIDSGVYSHPDLAVGGAGRSRVVYRQSFIGGVKQYDDYGHGTHVAGIAAGNGHTSLGAGSFRTLRGIAPNANILDLRVLDMNGMSNDSVVIAAIQQAVNLKNTYNVRVINLSLGRPIYEQCSLDPVCRAAEAAWNSGIVVVTAAGNLGRNGYATILCPGNSPSAITVGAMKTMGTYTRGDDLIASYSSRGPSYIDQTVKPDLVAPGNLVVSLLAPGSTLAAEYPGNIIPSSYYTTSGTVVSPAYFRLSGTSMATPVVAGSAAVMLQQDPTLTPDMVKARLMKTASKALPLVSFATDPATGATYTDTYDPFTVGAGYLDIAAVLANTDRASSSARSPGVAYSPLTQQGYLITDPSSVWGTSALWGTSAMWGSSAMWGTSALWGSSAMWGTSAMWGSSAMWGTSAMWGSSVNGGGEK